MRPRDLRLPSRHPSHRTTFLALGLAISLGALSGLAGCAIDTRSVGVMAGANGSLGGAANGGASSEAGDGGALAQGGGAGDGALGGATNGGAAGAGAEATGGSGPDAGATDAGSEPPVVLLPACAEHLLASPGTVTASTSNATGAFTLSCGSRESDDVSYYFVAAEAGYYQRRPPACSSSASARTRSRQPCTSSGAHAAGESCSAATRAGFRAQPSWYASWTREKWSRSGWTVVMAPERSRSMCRTYRGRRAAPMVSRC